MHTAFLRNRSTLIDYLYPWKHTARNVVLISLGTALMATCSQITIPWEPVPFTLQTFAVFTCGLVLGPQKGMMSQIFYLMLALFNVPVLAGWSSGTAKLFGATGGYLLSFILVAWLLGKLAEKGWDRSVKMLALAMVIGNGLIWTIGALWLSNFIGLKEAVKHGILPFIPGSMIKSVAATLLFPASWRIMKKV